MDGPLIVHLVLYVVVPIIWVYKRFFETAGLESKELLAFCRARPVLAALQVPLGRATEVAARLRTALGRKGELAITLGRWPWTHHVVRVTVVAEATSVRVVAIDCRVRRMKEERAKPITDLVRGVVHAFGLADEDTWFEPLVYSHQLGIQAPHGWRLVSASTHKFPLEPWEPLPAFSVTLGRERARGRPRGTLAIESLG